jgi:hypothetical protein
MVRSVFVPGWNPVFCWLPFGYVKIAIENDRVEIVDLPIDSMVIFHNYASLPEGNRFSI